MTSIITKEYQNFSLNIIPALKDNYIFLLQCFKSHKIIVIDPGEFLLIDQFLQEKNLNLDFILITHPHFDHIGAIPYLKEKYNCQVIVFEKDQYLIPQTDITLQLNSDHNFLELKLGEITFQVLTTFGHTAQHISYFIAKDNILFCGDTLFSSGCGRVFPDGSLENLFASLNKIKQLPLETEIFCAHEYTLKNIEFALTLEPNNSDLLRKKEKAQKLRGQDLPTIPTTLKNELKTNPFLRTHSEKIRHILSADKNKTDLEIFKIIRQIKDRM